ncbi:Gldg family protein [Paludicola sp. MB14-C6]|uniref:Gldg family protein n=1 Tax=Paludihabitans sp. MB14-C6 TaxID=3070656 RepID=UPI0027DC0E1F|nr:Gldg family protein [Paludicola sp. MB14-C6]WMJ22134.1 Gldg family protein [Paludicola sp. MB14-C6]
MKKNVFANRRFKHGSLATIITIGFIVAIFIINFIATLLLERFPLNIDLTKEKRFALTQESVNYIKKLDQDVNMIVCADEATLKGLGDLYVQGYEIIKNYAKYNGKIDIKFVNLKKDPSFAKKYPKVTVNEGDIIIESKLRYKKVPINDLFESNQTEYGQVTYSSVAEQKLTSSLMYVTDKSPAVVTLIGGQDNVDVKGYTELLETNNYTIQSVNLLSQDIDAKSDLVILPTPKGDFTADQIKKLETYLDNNGKFGKSIVFVSAYNKEVGPLLKSFLADWGLEIGEGVITDSNTRNLVNNEFGLVNQLADESIKKQLNSADLPIITPFASPIKQLFTEKDNRKTAVITKSAATGKLASTDENKKLDATGEFNTMVRATREKYVGSTMKYSTIIALSSPEFLNTNFLQYAGCNNGDLVMTITNNLTEKEDAVKILPIQFANETITVSKAQVSIINLILTIIIPLVALVIGTVIWFRRRHL